MHQVHSEYVVHINLEDVQASLLSLAQIHHATFPNLFYTLYTFVPLNSSVRSKNLI